MTRALPFTQASLMRRITAAQKAGLRVTGIAPDGTVLTVQDGENTSASVHNDAGTAHAPLSPSKWEDVEA